MTQKINKKKKKFICECGQQFGWEKNLMEHQAKCHMKKLRGDDE